MDCVTRLLIALALGAAISTASCNSEVSNVQDAVRAQLKDPESARFENIRRVTVQTPGGGSATSNCGRVNGRNAFGGYVGFQDFAEVVERTGPNASRTPAGSIYVNDEPVNYLCNPDAMRNFHAASGGSYPEF